MEHFIKMAFTYVGWAVAATLLYLVLFSPGAVSGSQNHHLKQDTGLRWNNEKGVLWYACDEVSKDLSRRMYRNFVVPMLSADAFEDTRGDCILNPITPKYYYGVSASPWGVSASPLLWDESTTTYFTYGNSWVTYNNGTTSDSEVSKRYTFTNF